MVGVLYVPRQGCACPRCALWGRERFSAFINACVSPFHPPRPREVTVAAPLCLGGKAAQGGSRNSQFGVEPGAMVLLSSARDGGMGVGGEAPAWGGELLVSLETRPLAAPSSYCRLLLVPRAVCGNALEAPTLGPPSSHLWEGETDLSLVTGRPTAPPLPGFSPGTDRVARQNAGHPLKLGFQIIKTLSV